MAELVGGHGISLRTGELEQVVVNLSNLGFDTVEGLEEPMVADIIAHEDIKAQLQKGAMGRRARGLAIWVHSELA